MELDEIFGFHLTPFSFKILVKEKASTWPPLTQWEYFKSKARESLSNSNTYSRRKYDVETVFGPLIADGGMIDIEYKNIIATRAFLRK